MTYKEIQTVLRARGVTQRDLAKQAKVSESTISLFLRRRFKSERLSTLINKTIGVNGAI